MWYWQIMSLLFHLVHSSIVLFAITGWILPITRPYHFAMCILITLSWYGLGRYYYPGYCILTDYHFRILRKMGIDPHSQSYIHYLSGKLTPWNIPADVLDRWVVFLFFSAFACSAILWGIRFFESVLK